MANNIESRISALLELNKAIISLNKAQLNLQMETLEVQHTEQPEQSKTFLFALFFGLISTLGLGFSVLALGTSLTTPWIQTVGWALVFLGIAAQGFLFYRFIQLRAQWQVRDKKINEIRQLFTKLQKLNTNF